MIKTVNRLLGNVHGLVGVSLSHKLTPEMMVAKIQKAIEKLGPLDGAVILSDLIGSTQCRTCQLFLQKGTVEMVSGYNLPLLVKLATINQGSSLAEVVSVASQYGQKYIIHQTGNTKADIALKNCSCT